MRHNLSRHKYFVKTCEKNAQGHYWSIDQAYLAIFKNGDFDEKSIKKAKLSSKLKNKAAKLIKKSRKNNTNSHQEKSKPMAGCSFDLSSSYVANSSEMSSPTLSCKSFNSSTLNNDSAYMSSTEYANASFQNYNHQSHGTGARTAEMIVGLNLRPNLNLHDALSEIYMDSGSMMIHEQKQQQQQSTKKIKKEPLLNYWREGTCFAYEILFNLNYYLFFDIHFYFENQGVLFFYVFC